MPILRKGGKGFFKNPSGMFRSSFLKTFAPTSRELAFRCKEVAEEAGLQRVRIGNLHLL